MVIAVKIGVGETVSPWGSHTIDNFRCADLTLRFPEQMSYKCSTTTKARCARFKFNGSEGVMVEHAVSTLSED